MEASSGVQLDGSTTIEVDEGARGVGSTWSRRGFAGIGGALFIVSNTNVIVVCNDDDDDSVLLIVCFA